MMAISASLAHCTLQNICEIHSGTALLLKTWYGSGEAWRHLGFQHLVSGLLHGALQHALQPGPVSGRQLARWALPAQRAAALWQRLQRRDVHHRERCRQQRGQPLQALCGAPRLCLQSPLQRAMIRFLLNFPPWQHEDIVP